MDAVNQNERYYKNKMSKYERKTKKKSPSKPHKTAKNAPKEQGEEITKDNRGSKPGEFGMKAYEPTKREAKVVERMASRMMTQEEIAEILSISIDTLQKYYATEFKRGKINQKQRVITKFMQGCLKGCATRQIFYLKTQCQWKETQAHEHTGKDGSPIETRQLPATDEWLKQFARNGAKDAPKTPRKD